MKTPQPNAKPWWKYGYVWLMIGLPAFSVVAGCAMMWLAVSGSDKLVAEDYYRRGIEINKQLAAERALLPAQQGRNHAATPTRD
jgi:uncharacterized protein